MPNPSPTPLSPNGPYSALLRPTRPYSALLGPTRPEPAPRGPHLASNTSPHPKTASASALASASVPLCATLLNPANAADPKTASASVPLCATLLNPANAAAYPASENISQIDSLELSSRLLSSEVACVSQCMPNPSPALTGPTEPHL